MAVAEAPSSSSVLLFQETRDQRLADVYAPCFTLALHLRTSQEFGDAEVLRRRIKDLLDRAQREGLRAGIPSEDLRLAKFAVVAFLDETILSSNASQKDHWLSTPLQLELYDRFDAGEHFFDELDRLRAQPELYSEVLEVYYLCMALGFKGRYQLQDQEQLRFLIEDTYAQLSRTPGLREEALSPHGKPRDQAATEVKHRLPTWAVVAFAAAIGLLLYLVLWFSISNTANDTLRTIEQLPRAERTL